MVPANQDESLGSRYLNDCLHATGRQALFACVPPSDNHGEVLTVQHAVTAGGSGGSTLNDAIRQAFAVLPPVKTVVVMSDARTYEYVVGLRAVTSTDGMTADFYPFGMKFLGETATRIDEVKGVNRVVCDVTSKPPGTIEWE